jgi:hypothetical protein
VHEVARLDDRAAGDGYAEGIQLGRPTVEAECARPLRPGFDA